MRILPPGLQSHLDSATTTLCHCWRLTLRNGEKLGFTDHDVALSLDGTLFEAQAGFTGSEIESSLGLSVDNLDATGALESGRLDDARLRAGDFDHATIEIWRVNWNDVSQRLLLRKGHLGEVSYGDGAFTAEVRGLAHVLNQPKGRIYQNGCDALLGDGRCGVNTTAPTWRGIGVVTAVQGAYLTLSDLSFADDWFTRGTATWLTGAGQGRTLPVKRHRNRAGNSEVEFWQVLPFAVVAGDSVSLLAGCDKQFSTCQAKFSNAINFRGFPHMPGTDFVATTARQGDPTNDGARRS
jgi:uncharacterized phage protein (TIGR02218 family)